MKKFNNYRNFIIGLLAMIQTFMEKAIKRKH